MLGSLANTAVPAPRLRVLVVEDSLTIRKYLVGLLESAGIEVVGEAEDGLRAAALCQQLRPDVVTMDMILPGISGLAATEQIMAYSPTPILIVSASTNRGEVFHTYEALSAGAVDVLDKVKAGETSDDWQQRFIAAVRMAARIKVITHPRARLSRWNLSTPERSSEKVAAVAPPYSGSTRAAETESLSEKIDLIAIGASTGGPAAIAEILRALPSGYPIPLLIVLHISEMFAFALAEWINTVSPVPARYAREGEPIPQPGQPQVILAPAGKHLAIEGGRLHLSEAAERNSCRPSIDVLFESLARQPELRALLCLLTGMGKDGAEGMLAAHRAGLQTLAQDEASSIIFGMPAEAIRLGAAQRVLSLDQICSLLVSAAPMAGSRSLNSLTSEKGRLASWP